MGGDLWVETEELKPTTFFLSLKACNPRQDEQATEHHA